MQFKLWLEMEFPLPVVMVKCPTGVTTEPEGDNGEYQMKSYQFGAGKVTDKRAKQIERYKPGWWEDKEWWEKRKSPR